MTARATLARGAGRNATTSARNLLSGARAIARFVPSPTATPIATTMVLLQLMAALLLRLHPGDVDAVVAWASTNVHNLAHHPLSALVLSAFVVTGNLLPNLVIVGVSFVVLERAVGPRRTLLFAVTGQVLATLLTEYGAVLGAHWGVLAESSSERADVGVSYVMFAVLAAAIVSLRAPLRHVGLLGVGGYVLLPFIASPGMTTTGHVISVAVGATLMAFCSGPAAVTAEAP